jgi:hypothetical protein
VDKNGNGIYDPGEDRYEDIDHNGQFTWPSEVKITNARYYLPSGRSIHTELDIDGKVIHQGGVTPDREVAMDYMEPWENAELVRTFDRLRKGTPEGTTFKSPFTQYVEDHFEANKQLFYALADDDGRDANRYPDFAAFKTSLNTHLPDDTLRKLLRVSVRDRVQDDRGRLFVGINFRGDRRGRHPAPGRHQDRGEKASPTSRDRSHRFFAEAPVATRRRTGVAALRTVVRRGRGLGPIRVEPGGTPNGEPALIVALPPALSGHEPSLCTSAASDRSGSHRRRRPRSRNRRLAAARGLPARDAAPAFRCNLHKAGRVCRNEEVRPM